MTANEEASEALASTHRLKLKPPTCGGNYATFEEWKYEFTAYMGKSRKGKKQDSQMQN